MGLNRFDVMLHSSQYGARIKEVLEVVEGMPHVQAVGVLLSAACLVVARMPKSGSLPDQRFSEEEGRCAADNLMEWGASGIGAFLARLAVIMPKVHETILDVEGGVEEPDFIQKIEQIDRVMEMNCVDDLTGTVCFNPTKGDV